MAIEALYAASELGHVTFSGDTGYRNEDKSTMQILIITREIQGLNVMFLF